MSYPSLSYSEHLSVGKAERMEFISSFIRRRFSRASRLIQEAMSAAIMETSCFCLNCTGRRANFSSSHLIYTDKFKITNFDRS